MVGFAIGLPTSCMQDSRQIVLLEKARCTFGFGTSCGFLQVPVITHALTHTMLTRAASANCAGALRKGITGWIGSGSYYTSWYIQSIGRAPFELPTGSCVSRSKLTHPRCCHVQLQRIVLWVLCGKGSYTGWKESGSWNAQWGVQCTEWAP